MTTVTDKMAAVAIKDTHTAHGNKENNSKVVSVSVSEAPIREFGKDVTMEATQSQNSIGPTGAIKMTDKLNQISS